MNAFLWIGLFVLLTLSLLVFVMVKRDAQAYLESQIKVLGKENSHYFNINGVKRLFIFYAFSLVLILGFFLFYALFAYEF